MRVYVLGTVEFGNEWDAVAPEWESLGRGQSKDGRASCLIVQLVFNINTDKDYKHDSVYNNSRIESSASSRIIYSSLINNRPELTC